MPIDKIGLFISKSYFCQLATLRQIGGHNVLSRHAGEVDVRAAAFADGEAHQAIDVFDEFGAIEGGGVVEVVVVIEGDLPFAEP